LTGQQVNGIMQYIKQRRYKKYSYGAFYIKERCEAKELGGRAFCIRIFLCEEEKL